MPSTPTRGLHHHGFFSLTHVFVSIVVIPLVCGLHFVGIVTSYITLLRSSVSRGSTCISVVFSLMIVDCFGLCPMVVSLMEGFST